MSREGLEAMAGWKKKEGGVGSEEARQESLLSASHLSSAAPGDYDALFGLRL
jgi:hypothetical protein